MTVPTFRETAAVLRENGYLPIPIAPYSKRPLLDAWQKYEFASGDEKRVPADAGVGILCGLVRGIDIDVTRDDVARSIQEAAIKTWGAPLWRVGMAPKVLVLVRTASVGHKLFSLRFRFADDPPGSKPHGVEILGHGQQFVAYGKHPDTRREYEWPNLDLLEVPATQLPVATEDELHNFLAWVNNLLLDAGGVPVGNLAHKDTERRTSNDELGAYNSIECRAAIDAISNDDLSWDDWIYIGLAIKGALGESGRAAFHAFSSKSNKYDPAVTDRTFSSFKPERIGAGTLYRIAFDGGWTRPLPLIDISGLVGHSGPVVNAAEFAAAWTPTQYVVKGLVQRGHLCSLTGHSNAGKTAIAIRMAVCVALGTSFGRHKTSQGKVVYFAGENADDIRCRLIALSQDLNIDLGTLGESLYVVPLAFPLAQHLTAIKEELAKLGDLSMIVVDTRAAYASAQDENDNMQALADARAVRELMNGAGRPAAVVLNHPPHRAEPEHLKPRGGSAYWGEIDSNLTAWNDNSGNIVLHWNKIRGAPWEPVNLTLRPYVLLGFSQPDGDAVHSVIADIASDEQAEAIDEQTRSDEDLLLLAMTAKPNGSNRSWAEACGWKNGKNRVHRLLGQLKADGLVRLYRRRWIVTKKGETEAAEARIQDLPRGKDRGQRCSQ